MLNRSNYHDNTSTPKRRRLGTGRILRPLLKEIGQSYTSSPVPSSLKSQDRCDSPPIPCNQIEYLIDSSNNSSRNCISNIPQSPVFFQDSFNDINSLRSRKLSKDVTSHSRLIQEEIDNISDDMFVSNLEVQNSLCNEMLSDSTFNINHELRVDVENTFESVNKSICALESNQNIHTCKENLFETRDSFLLEIKDTCDLLAENKEKNENNFQNYEINNGFYGLPLKAKALFKSCRNIEKFYDWQEECLKLNAIRNKTNLIYALPTSGGKTLVAEVLMLREVLNNKCNALFVLPFVAIVQEKIWGLSPFAVQLGFLVEEYAAGKGNIPPVKRRNKHTIYIATIEKALALVRSLIELNRLNEIGLIVIDELHLIGEEGRGSTLETLLSTIIFANKGIQIVGMSATIGNLSELASFLDATIYERKFRPVELAEYVKLGNMLHRIRWTPQFEVVPERELKFDYSQAAQALDPDYIGGLVSEVGPEDGCLIFCPTKKNCENVAVLLCKMQRKEMAMHRSDERLALSKHLKDEGASKTLVQCVRYGVAYHHAGLGGEERVAVENGFRAGVICALCCTSTLAAGVNLPARRVVLRAPRVGSAAVSMSGYRQMTGRAGRAGQAVTGESIVICAPHEWPDLRATFEAGLGPTLSSLHINNGNAINNLLLSAIGLNMARNRTELRNLLSKTLMAAQAERLNIDVKTICDNSIRYLLKNKAIGLSKQHEHKDKSHIETDDKVYIYNDSPLVISELGNAAIKGCLDLETTRLFLEDLDVASRGLVLTGSLHLLYLVTPHDTNIKPDYRHYYNLYCSLNEECLLTAKVLGITEKNAIKMITGKPITNVSEKVLKRFYMALMLYDIWNEMDFAKVAEKYSIPRGTLQQVLTSACAASASYSRAAADTTARWGGAVLLAGLAERLRGCGRGGLVDLVELPSVNKARANQLYKAGFRRIEEVARAKVEDLCKIPHVSRTVATHIISAARMILIEKVENLRAEAEDVMDELNM